MIHTELGSFGGPVPRSKGGTLLLKFTVAKERSYGNMARLSVTVLGAYNHSTQVLTSDANARSPLSQLGKESEHHRNHRNAMVGCTVVDPSRIKAGLLQVLTVESGRDNMW